MTISEHAQIRTLCKKHAAKIASADERDRVAAVASGWIDASAAMHGDEVGFAALRVAAKVVSELAKEERR